MVMEKLTVGETMKNAFCIVGERCEGSHEKESAK